MNTTENQSKETLDAKSEKKELTPQQVQRRKKMVVFPLMFLLFAGAMWLIFAPSGKEKEAAKEGLNTDLPTPKESGIIGGKIDAYTQEAMQNKQQEKMRSLQDFAFALGENEEPEEQLRMTPQPAVQSHNAFQSSTYAYEDVNRQLGNFYEQPATEADEQAQLALEWRIQELERQLEEQTSAKNAEAEQLALIEKSYEIAARYMGTGQQSSGSDAPPTQVIASSNGKATIQPVTQARRDVVSLLAAPISDSDFVEDFVKPRNWGFNTAAGDEDVQDKNSIRACIYRTVTITDGGQVALRLLEPMKAGSMLIPANSVINGSAKISGERMSITISAIQHAGNVIPVELMAYDMDGGQGISVPGSEEINAVKEIAAGMGSNMGSSITITDNAGSQLLSDLGRSAIQGASQYVSKKMRAVKVTLKAGYQVLLLPPMK